MTQELQKKFGLNTKLIEKDVLEVINKDQFINIDALKEYLKKCILITSGQYQYKKNEVTGINAVLSHVYFILLDYDNNDLMIKYRKIAKQTIDEDSLIDSYFERPQIADSIDTLYSAEEVVL